VLFPENPATQMIGDITQRLIDVNLARALAIINQAVNVRIVLSKDNINSLPSCSTKKLKIAYERMLFKFKNALNES